MTFENNFFFFFLIETQPLGSSVSEFHFYLLSLISPLPPHWVLFLATPVGSGWINASLMDSLEVGTAEDLTLYNSPPGKVKPNRQRDPSIYTNIGAGHAK